MTPPSLRPLLALGLVLALLTVPSTAVGQAPHAIDATAALRIQVLEAERQAFEQRVLRLRAEARALTLELPEAQAQAEAKGRAVREAMERAAKAAGLSLEEWVLDFGGPGRPAAWRPRGPR